MGVYEKREATKKESGIPCTINDPLQTEAWMVVDVAGVQIPRGRAEFSEFSF